METMFGTFPSLIHSVFPPIPDSEYTVQQRCLPLLRRTFHNNRLRVLIAWLTGDFKSGRRGPRPIQGFTLPRNQETPIFHRPQITYMFRNKSTSHTHEYGPAAVLWWRGEECTRRRQRVLIISCDMQDGETMRLLLTSMGSRKVAP